MIKVQDFCDKHDISRNLVYIKIFNGLQKEAYFKDKKDLYINEEFLHKRVLFKKQSLNKMHDNYYFLSMFFSDSSIARMIYKIDNTIPLTSWMTFMSHVLFSLSSNKEIFDTRLSSREWKFYRCTRWIINAIFIKYKVKKEFRNVSLLLDNYALRMRHEYR